MIGPRPYRPRIKLELRRKEPDPKPAHACSFVCVGCGRTLETHELSWNEWLENHRPPLCHGCTLTAWGRVSWIEGMSSAEYSGLQRLAAVIGLIEREVAHGRRIRAAG